MLPENGTRRLFALRESKTIENDGSAAQIIHEYSRNKFSGNRERNKSPATCFYRTVKLITKLQERDINPARYSQDIRPHLHR